MADKHRIIIDVDRSQLFDSVAAVGDGGASVGLRLASTLRGDSSMATQVGLAVYGIDVIEEVSLTLSQHKED